MVRWGPISQPHHHLKHCSTPDIFNLILHYFIFAHMRIDHQGLRLPWMTLFHQLSILQPPNSPQPLMLQYSTFTHGYRRLFSLIWMNLEDLSRQFLYRFIDKQSDDVNYFGSGNRDNFVQSKSHNYFRISIQKSNNVRWIFITRFTLLHYRILDFYLASGCCKIRFTPDSKIYGKLSP